MVFKIRNTGWHRLSAVRFIPQKKWFVVGDYKGQIHLYTYTRKDKLKEFHAHASCVSSLAVHPTDPLVLSSSGDNLIKLWNWDNDWECIRTFEAHSKEVESVKFNPLTESNTFASASRDGTIKIWSMFSDTPITTLECGTAQMTKVSYFAVPSSHQCIVAGSECGTAHIWDLETNTCIRHDKGLHPYSSVAVLDCQPGHPIWVTASSHGKVSFCNSTNHRYQSKVNFKLGYIMDYAYIKGTRRYESMVDFKLGNIMDYAYIKGTRRALYSEAHQHVLSILAQKKPSSVFNSVC